MPAVFGYSVAAREIQWNRRRAAGPFKKIFFFELRAPVSACSCSESRGVKQKQQQLKETRARQRTCLRSSGVSAHIHDTRSDATSGRDPICFVRCSSFVSLISFSGQRDRERGKPGRSLNSSGTNDRRHTLLRRSLSFVRECELKNALILNDYRRPVDGWTGCCRSGGNVGSRGAPPPPHVGRLRCPPPSHGPRRHDGGRNGKFDGRAGALSRCFDQPSADNCANASRERFTCWASS